MSAALRWGLLGTAHINRRLIPAMRAVRRSRIAAVASRDPVRARAYAAEWDIPVAHDGYAALLRDRAIDAVYIPLPNALHVEWGLRALDAGKHVLCEKPLALAPDDVDRLEAVARGRGRVVAEAFMYRHEPLVARIGELLGGRAIGSLRAIAAGFTFSRTRMPDVRLDPALGGGSLWDVGCYAVNAARLAAGSEPVEASGFAAIGATGVDESFSGLLRFPAALVATIQCSFQAPYRSWLEVTGERGVLRVANIFRPAPLETIELALDGSVQRIPVDGSELLFARMVEDFVAAALDGAAPAVTLADSRGNAAALAGLYAAARTGRAVQI